MSLWDRVKTGVSRAASEAEKQTTIARLNMQLGDERMELRKKITDLGEATLELCRAGKIRQESLKPLFDDIKAQETKIQEMEAQIVSVKDGGDKAD